MSRHRGPFADIKPTAVSDQVQIGKRDRNVFTYRPLRRTRRARVADVYRIDTVTPSAVGGAEQGRHYIVGDKLNTVLLGWHETAETIVDVRPMSVADALSELKGGA